MRTRLELVVKWLENFKIPLWAWIIELFIFATVRYTIEGSIYGYSYDFIILFHAITYYLYIFTFVFMVVKIITDEKIEKISSIFAFFIPVILIPPLIDHYIFGRIQGYPYLTKLDWSITTFSFFQKYPTLPSHGYQVEFGIYLFLLFIYVYLKLKDKKVIQRAVFSFSAVFTTYILIMLLSTPKLSPIFNFLYLPLTKSIIVKDFYYWIYIFRYEFLSLLFLFISGLIGNYKKMVYILRDASPLRTLHFVMMYFLGFYIVQSTLKWGTATGRTNIILLIMGILSAVLGWFFIVGINNYYDKRYDAITNAKRGLPSGKYNPKELLYFSITSGILGTFILIPIGILPLIFYLIYLFLGVIYSYPLLYLKRYGIKTLFVGAGSSLIFAVGYFTPLYSFNHGLNVPFYKYFILLFIIFSIGSAINDLKDYKSDKISGVKTIFTYFGRKNGIKIMSILLFFAFVLPIIVCPSGLVPFSILAIISSYLFWKEKVFFVYVTYFIEYILLIFLL